MAYVQVLALVLCSLFVQDALSGTPEVRGSQRTTGAVVANATPPAARALKRSATTPAVPIKRTASMGPRAGSGVGVGARKKAETVAVPSEEPAVMRTMRRTRTVKAARAAPPPPPPKYPNLAKAEAMMWAVAEDMNRTNESGKLTVRSVRNTIGDLLKSHVFWNTLVANIRRRAKLTHNPQRAKKLIENSKALTALLTGPMAARGLEKLVDDVYEAAVAVKPCTRALSLATEIANGRRAIEGLTSATYIVQHVQYDPELVTKGFQKIRKFIESGGAIDISEGMARGLLTVSSRLNKQQSLSRA